MATATLLVNGDGTKGSWTDSGGGTSNLFGNINTGTGSPNDSTLIKCSATNNAIYLLLENMPADFSYMAATIVVKIRARADTTKGDIRGLGACGIVGSDESTAMTDTSTPSITNSFATYTLNLNVVLSQYHKFGWDGARLKITTNNGTTGGVEVTEVQVDITYTAISPWVFINGTQKTAASSANSTTSSGIDTTGADLIVVVVSVFGNNAITFSDSNSNTWNALTFYGGASQVGVRMYWSKPTSVGSGHTFTAASSGAFSCLHVVAFAGAKATSPIDQSNGAATTTTATSRQPGSITPTENNELLIAGQVNGASTSAWAIDSSFVLFNGVSWSNTVTMGGMLGFFIQTTAAAINPTLSWTGSSTNRVNIASFKQEPAAAGGQPAARRFGLARRFENVRDIGHKNGIMISRKELLLPKPKKLITVA